MNIRAVIWDFDNTLVNQTKAFQDTLQAACLEVDAEYEPLQVEAALKTNCAFDELFVKLFTKEGEIERVRTKYREIAPKVAYSACSMGNEVVSKLQQRKVLQLILTNRANLVPERLGQAGYDAEVFEKIVTPKVKKPDSQAYEEVLKLLSERDVAKADVLSIGDHIDDYKAAAAAGIAFCAVTTGLSKEADFVEEGLAKKRVFTDLGALLASDLFV